MKTIRKQTTWSASILVLLVCTGTSRAFEPTNYNYRLKIEFTGYDKTETLTNFPALTIFSNGIENVEYGASWDSRTDFAYTQFQAAATGGDLRFTDSSTTNELNFEIEEWDTNDNSYVWVQVPELVDSNTTIYAYWGNSSDTNLPSSTS